MDFTPEEEQEYDEVYQDFLESWRRVPPGLEQWEADDLQLAYFLERIVERDRQKERQEQPSRQPRESDTPKPPMAEQPPKRDMGQSLSQILARLRRRAP